MAFFDVGANCLRSVWVTRNKKSPPSRRTRLHWNSKITKHKSLATALPLLRGAILRLSPNPPFSLIRASLSSEIEMGNLGGIAVILLSGLLLLSSDAFYLPGVAPRGFQQVISSGDFDRMSVDLDVLNQSFSRIRPVWICSSLNTLCDSSTILMDCCIIIQASKEIRARKLCFGFSDVLFRFENYIWL